MIALVDTSLRLSVVLAIALVASAALRDRAASLRHALLAGGLLLAAFVAPLSWILPAWHVRVPAWHVSGGSSGVVETTLRTLVVSSADGGRITSSVVVGLWLAGVVICLVSTGVALASLRRLSRQAHSIETGTWRAVTDEIRAEMRIRRRVRVIEAPECRLVATWGVWRPRIIVPADAADWPREHIDAVVRHEMAHIARFDWPVQIAAQLVCAGQWFNPLCWAGLRRLRELSEMACDDEVVRASLRPQDYALRLVEITRASRSMPLPAAALPMARASNLERRIAAMLDPHIDRRPPSRWLRTAVFATLSLLVVSVSALRATQAAKPAEPAISEAKQAPLKVGGAVKPPRKIKDAPAVYPEAMKEARISGTVELEVTVGKDGSVRKVHVLTTDVHPDLAVAAVDAVRQWKFEPALLNGAPVDVMMNCTIAFRLK